MIIYAANDHPKGLILSSRTIQSAFNIAIMLVFGTFEHQDSETIVLIGIV